MKNTLFLLSLLIISFPFTLPAEEAVLTGDTTRQFQWRKIDTKAFHDGEVLEYSLSFGVISIGNTRLELGKRETLNGRECYHVKFQVWTNSFADKVYKMRNTEEAWMDTESLCTHRYTKTINEKDMHWIKNVDFDHVNGTFTYTERNVSNPNEHRTVEGNVPPYISDELTALYYVRTQPLEVGKEYIVDTQSEDKMNRTKYVVLKKEKVKVKCGTFDCFKLEPLIFDTAKGDLKRQKLWLWITVDTRRLLVLMKSKLVIGSITTELEKMP